MKTGRIIDVTRSIHEGMTVWPGDDGVKINRVASIPDGDVCNLSSISIGVHTGTHVDAPLHFIDRGRDISSLDLSRFIGLAKVFEVDAPQCITRSHIEHLPIQRGDIVLFKTSNSLLPEERFFTDFVYLDASAADFLVEKGVRTVGIDYFSVDRFEASGHPVHHRLLSGEMGIIEGLRLKDVREGTYFLSCLPLRIEGVDGSPVRAVLLEIEE